MSAGMRHTGGATWQQLAAKIKGLGGPTFRADVGAAMGAAALRQVFRGFRESVDPYGKPWAPVDRTQAVRGGRQGPRRRGRPLIKTGHLRASASMETTGDGFRIGMAAEYARYHQYGTRGRRGRGLRRFSRSGGITRRMMIPTRQAGGLGDWAKPLNAAARRVVNEWRKL